MKKIFFFVILICPKIIFANVEITSLMPNTDDDTKLEYIEVTNNFDNQVSLSGYKLEDKAGASYTMNDIILSPGEAKRFYYKTTKIRLNNTNEIVNLYDDKNNLIDEVSYSSSQKNKEIVIKELEKTIIVGKTFEGAKVTGVDKGMKIIMSMIFLVLVFVCLYFLFIKNSSHSN